mmetsp:Transcript_1762/g.4564  ORF Transcript_1762/g.4564 Transcript_1762/m.4564 type:complete len:219 (+) Transcript_1762:117-773(+)
MVRHSGIQYKRLALFFYFSIVSFKSLLLFVDGYSLHRVSISSSISSWNHGSTTRSVVGKLSYPNRQLGNNRGSMLFLQEPSTQERQEIASLSEEEEQARASSFEEVEPPSVKDTIRKVGKNVGKAAVYGFSFFMNIVGLYFTVGLILNIFGFAYEFSFKDGYKIDTIQNKRIERQFERESRRYEKERNDKLLQSSSALTEDRSRGETALELSTASLEN